MKLCLSFFILFFFGSFVIAGDLERKTGEAFAKAYTEETLKKSLAKYLDAHPEAAFSKSATIGTDSMRFLGRAMAGYTLLTAKSDRERMWAGANLILSPEPTTCLILVAVQLMDTYMTMRNQRDVAKIYEHVAELQAQTIAILTKLEILHATQMQAVVDRAQTALATLQALIGKMQKDRLYLVLTGTKTAELSPDEIAEGMQTLSDLRGALLELDLASIYLHGTVNVEQLGLPDDLFEKFDQAAKVFDPLREQLEALGRSYGYFFGSLKAKELTQQVAMDTAPYATELRIYTRCAEYQNRLSTETFWQAKKTSFSSDQFLNDCRQKFSTLKGISQ